MVYLPTFSLKITQTSVNIPYMEHMGNLGIMSKNRQKSYPKNNPRMKTIIKQSCRKRKKLHQEVPRHHNFTIFTSQLCVFPRRHPRPPRFVAQEANSASFRAGFRRRLAGTCRFSDFGRSLFFHQYLWKSIGKIKIYD